MEKMNDLKDLLKHEIQDLCSAEEQILDALPKMIERASNANLKKALNDHLKITEQHKTRLDKIQKTLNAGEDGKKKGFLSGLFNGKQTCKGMQGIIEEGNKIMSADVSPEALDAAIIASAQKVEHYEICSYGTAKSFAKELGMDAIAKQLEQTLNEEYEADVLLTQLAEERINFEAENAEASSSTARNKPAARAKEKSSRQMEMETVASNRGSSSGRGNTTSSKTSSTQKGNNKPSGSSSRSEGSGRSISSSQKATAGKRGSESSKSSEVRSSSGARGSSTNSRGRR